MVNVYDRSFALSVNYQNIRTAQRRLKRYENIVLKLSPHLPASVCCSIIRIIPLDVTVDPTQRHLTIRSRADGLHYQLCVRERWLVKIIIGVTWLNSCTTRRSWTGINRTIRTEMCDEASSNGYSNNKNVTAPRLSLIFVIL